MTPSGRASGKRRAGAFGLLFSVFMIPAALFVVFSWGGPASAGVRAAALRQARIDLAGQGQILYEEHCSSCHGADAGGTAQGPSIIGKGAADYDFMLSTGRMPLAQPGAQAVRKQPVLTPSEIRAITAFLSATDARAGTPIPDVHPGAGSLSEGEGIYQLNCAPCHSATGNGGAVGPQSAPNLKVAAPVQIGEAVRIGPGTMPVFDQSGIDDQQLNSLIRYVLYLRAPDNRGGLSLNLGGPVVEGFVGLIIGLGAIVIVMRFIGERS